MERYKNGIIVAVCGNLQMGFKDVREDTIQYIFLWGWGGC